MSEVRIAKFETLIEDINSELDSRDFSSGVYRGLMSGICQSIHDSFYGSKYNVALSLIFNYDSCNEYAKKIIETSQLFINSWKNLYPEIASSNDTKTKIDAAKAFVKYCRDPEHVSEGYKFIFWSLMILTVDKNNVEEYLTLICDFAKMLRITDEEFEDIIYAIKCVYNEVDKEYIFKSESVPNILGGIFNLYGGQEVEEFVGI